MGLLLAAVTLRDVTACGVLLCLLILLFQSPFSSAAVWATDGSVARIYAALYMCLCVYVRTYRFSCIYVQDVYLNNVGVVG